MTDSEGWIFSDLEPKKVHDFPDSIEPYMLLTTQEQWDNFSDMEAYDFEKRLREFLKYLSEHSKYHGRYNRRFTFQMIYQRLYGKEMEAPRSHQSNVLRQICIYYSSALLENTYIGEKRCKKVYVLAYSRLKKRPWCIRLRLEWFVEHNEEITPGKLRCIKTDLQWGHARNARTERNMQARRERAKQAYKEKYGNPEYRAKYSTPEYRAYLKEKHANKQ